MFVGNERLIEVRRKDLIEKLENTLVTYKKEYEESVNNWREAYKAYAEALLDRVNDGIFSESSFNIPRPTDNSKAIERAKTMVEMSVKDTVTLDEVTFDQWVMGNWHFRNGLSEISQMAVALSGTLRKKA